jgi:hypothetical protein
MIPSLESYKGIQYKVLLLDRFKIKKIIMNKFVLLFVFATVFLCNCQSPKGKKSHLQLKHLNYEVNDLLIGYGGFMLATNNNQIVGLDYREDFFFYRLNVNHPDEFYRFGQKGQGPDELIHPMSVQYLNDNLIGCYDVSAREFCEIVLNPNPEHLKSKKKSFTSDVNFSILKTRYNQYVGMGPHPDEMFVLYDSLGHKIKSFFEFPFRDADERRIKNPLRAMAYQGRTAVNPSGTKLVYAASYADVIHFYTITDNDIQLIKKRENRFCEYIPEEQGGGVSARLSPTNRNGYIDLYATDQYVYLLYSGKTFQEHKEKARESNQLLIYDWEGNLLKEAILDISCKFLCVSPDDKNMWAIAEIPEPTIVQFNLTNLD